MCGGRNIASVSSARRSVPWKHTPADTDTPATHGTHPTKTLSPTACRLVPNHPDLPEFLYSQVGELRRIFDRYYRVERRDSRGVAGVGLGLSLVLELVETLGGSIAVESGLGQGSRFTVTLPLRHPAAGHARRTTNRPRTKVSDDSTRSDTDPGMSPIWHGSSNF